MGQPRPPRTSQRLQIVATEDEEEEEEEERKKKKKQMKGGVGFNDRKLLHHDVNYTSKRSIWKRGWT